MKMNMLIAALTILSAGGVSMAQNAAVVGAEDKKDSAGQAARKRNLGSDEAGPWYTRVGIAEAIYHPGADVSAAGAEVPAASATVTSNTTLTADLGYYFTENLAVSIMVGVPPKPTLSGAGAIAQFEQLGSVRYGPVVASGHYHFPKLGAFQPYIGGGVAYAIIFADYDGSIAALKVQNSFAPVLQVGADYRVHKNWGVFADCKQVWLSVGAAGAIEGAVPVKADVKLWPTVLSFGVTYHF